MTRQKAIAALLCAAALTACDYEKNAVQDITGFTPVAGIRFFNFGVNAPGVNFYANDTKMTAISSATGTESTNGTTSGGAGSGGFYDAIAPGSYAFTAKIAAATDKDLAITSVTSPIADAKFYSYYVSGFYDAATKKADAFVVEDAFPAQIDFSVAYIRFVNAISNSTPQTLFVKNSVGVEVPIGGGVAYKAASAFIPLPSGVYDLATRTAGSATNAIARTAVSFSGGRVYTIGSRGDMTIVSTTAATRPQLDFTSNR
ncbi:MAG: DUF4397 domain-containing protein [Gemmatimonadales bacterium]